MAHIDEQVADKTAHNQINETAVNILRDESLHPDDSNRTSTDDTIQNMTPQSETSKLENGDIKVVVSDSAKELAAPELKDYSSFGSWQKKWIVLAATIGAFYSPFTAQIYFPALTSIARDLHVSNAKVNLTMTTYMILQATAPAFIGGFSDTAGRRPAYVICFTIYIIADIALALQNNYVALLILRMLQSSGSSGTVAIANAVVADVATSAERGLYIGITSLTGILAPSLGPILGGVISQYAGWKWIFWFLAILAGCFFIPMLLFMPETCRKIVGDGSVPPPAYNRSLMNYINERNREKAGLGPPDYAERDALAKKRGPVRFPNPLKTLVIATDIECFLILFYASLVYAGFYAVISGMPSQLKERYGFSESIVGLMFLPIAGGSIVAAFTQGKVVDWSFAREAKKLGMPVTKSKQQDLINFPIEYARLRAAFPMVLLSFLATVCYGWLLHFRVSVAGVCVVLFFMGIGMIGATQCISILIVDINPGQAGTATAAFNLIRCLLGAGATAVILPMIDVMGMGWSYTLVGGIWVVLCPMLWVVIKCGPGWRKEKRAKTEKAAEVNRKRDEAKEGVEKV